MAARLNTKFILLVTVTTIVALGVVGGLFYLRLSTDTSRNIAEGDQHMAAGDYGRALTAYGRALSKDQSNLDLLERVESALVRVVPQTTVESQNRFRTYMQILERRTAIAPGNGEGWRPYLGMLHQLARLGDSPDAWRELEQAAERMVRQFPEGDPFNVDARLHRAIGALGRQRVLTDAEREEALDHLRIVIAARPSDDLAWSTLVRARQTAVEQLVAANRPSAQIAEARATAERTLADAINAAPQGTRVTIAELRALLARRLTDPQGVSIDRLDAVSSRLAINAAETDDVLLLNDVVDALASVPDPRSGRRALALANDFSERNPESLFGRFVALRAATLDDDHEGVERAAKAVLEVPLLPVGLEAAFRPRARSLAAERLFDVAFNRLERGSAEERSARSRAATEALEALRRERAEEIADPQDDPVLLKAEGRVAFAAERFDEALAKFERINRLLGATARDSEALFLSASAAMRRGEFGLARSRIDQALQAIPGQPVFLALRSQIRASVGDAAGAEQDIVAALRLAPDSDFVLASRRFVESIVSDAVRSLNESQQRLQRGDLDGARASVIALLAAEPENVFALRQRARIEAVAGERLLAAEYARAGLAIHPDDPDLRQLLIIAESQDRVEAIVGAAQFAVPEERLRPMSIHTALQREAALLRLRAEERRRRGNSEGAEMDRAEAARLESAQAEWRAKAAALDPPDPRFIQLTVDEAIIDGRLDEARRLVAAERGRPERILPAGALVRMECRILVAEAERAGQTDPARRRELLIEATRLATEARDRSPESSELHLLVGELHGFLGNLAESVEALERAYTIRPTDQRVVELYASALQRIGSRERLLNVLRSAARLGNVTPGVYEAWLDAEAIYGQPREALVRRRARWSESPTDTANALKLVNLLVTLVPTRELSVDTAGRERFTESQWRGMSQPEQRQALEALRRQWLDEARRVVDAIPVSDGNRFQVAAARSELARRRGDLAGGEQILRSAIADAGDAADAGMWLSLGNYLANIGRPADAEVAFAEAIRVQGPTREADRAMADLRSNQGRLDEAIGHLRSVLDAAPDRIAHLRLIELLQRVDRLEDAQAEFDRAVATHGADAQTLMVESLLLGRRAASADGETARELRRRQHAALDRAVDLASDDPTPLAAKAEAIVDDWMRGPAPDVHATVLNDAIVLLDRAIAIRADHWPSARLKAIIIARRGDLARARTELERHLRISPLNADARAMLIELWSASRNLERAIQVAQEAIDRSPMDSRWLVMLGDLRARAGDRAGAITAHRRALEVDAGRTPERLVMLLMEPDRAGRRDFGAVIQLVESDRTLVDRSPYLRSAYGAALVSTGQRDRGLEQLRLANGQYRQQIAARPDLARAIGGWYDQLQVVFSGPSRLAELEAFARSVSDIDSSWPDLQALGTRWAQSGPDGLSHGISLLNRAHELSRDASPNLRSTVLFDLGVAYVAADRCEDAVRMFREGVRLDPENAASINNLAYLTVTCLGTPADLEEGLRLVQDAIRLSPNVAEFHDTHGTVLSRLGRRSQAEAAFRTSIGIAPSVGTHLKLARLLADMGRPSDARTELRNIVNIDPRRRDDPEYRAIEAAIGGG